MTGEKVYRWRIPAVIYVNAPSLDEAQEYVVDGLDRVSDDATVLFDGLSNCSEVIKYEIEDLGLLDEQPDEDDDDAP